MFVGQLAEQDHPDSVLTDGEESAGSDDEDGYNFGKLHRELKTKNAHVTKDMILAATGQLERAKHTDLALSNPTKKQPTYTVGWLFQQFMLRSKSRNTKTPMCNTSKGLVPTKEKKLMCSALAQRVNAFLAPVNHRIYSSRARNQSHSHDRSAALQPQHRLVSSAWYMTKSPIAISTTDLLQMMEEEMAVLLSSIMLHATLPVAIMFFESYPDLYELMVFVSIHGNYKQVQEQMDPDKPKVDNVVFLTKDRIAWPKQDDKLGVLVGTVPMSYADYGMLPPDSIGSSVSHDDDDE